MLVGDKKTWKVLAALGRRWKAEKSHANKRRSNVIRDRKTWNVVYAFVAVLIITRCVSLHILIRAPCANQSKIEDAGDWGSREQQHVHVQRAESGYMQIKSK